MYITGHTNRSEAAVNNLNQLYEKYLKEAFEIMVIDTLENPNKAEEDNILATPTLIKHSQTGDSRIIGDLSNTPEILRLLGIHYTQNPNAEDTNDKKQ